LTGIERVARLTGLLLSAATVAVLLHPRGRARNLLSEWRTASERASVVREAWPGLRARSTFGSPPKPLLILVSSFDCEYCKLFVDSLRAAVAAAEGPRILVINRARQGDSTAQQSAIAAECATRRGFGWTAYEFLMQRTIDGASLDPTIRNDFPSELSPWRACLTSPAARLAVESDDQLARSMHIDGTPTLVNERGATLAGVQSVSRVIEFAHGSR